MAHGLNPELVKQIRHYSNWRGIVRHKSRWLINSVRAFAQDAGTSGSSTVEFPMESPVGISTNFDRQAEHFRANGWAFITDFFNPEVHEAVRDNWPSLKCFRLKGDPTKSYDFGPNWSKRSRQFLSGVNQQFYSGFSSLVSAEFAQRVTDFCGDNRSRATGGPTAVWSRHGSHLLPHLDDMSKFESSVVNIIIFVEGSSPPIQSGGTSLFRDNTFDQPLFIPPSLNNTALVYSTGSEFYHGFPMVRRRKFSKRIVLNFQPVDLLESEDVLTTQHSGSAR